MRSAKNAHRYLLAALACVIVLTPTITEATPQATPEDAAYAGQLGEQFAFLGKHRLAFARVEVSYGSRGRFPFIAVRFDVTAAEAVWLLRHARQHDLHAWGHALHEELRAHYGGHDFVAVLQWTYDAPERTAGDAGPPGGTNVRDQAGWEHAWHFVQVTSGGAVRVRAFH